MNPARRIPTAAVVFCLLALPAGSVAKPIVEIEEIITTYAPADNGAGPMWCYGSPLVVRQGQDVFISAIETGKDVPPLCNTRWQLWTRTRDAWKILHHEADYRQREPCPLIGFPDGRLFLSVNPSLMPPGTKYKPCRPLVLEFKGSASYQTHEPAWSEGTSFTDHSYRGFAADGPNRHLLLLNINNKTGEQFVSFRDRRGTWHARGTIRFPIRACYPQVALRDKAAHVMAIGDIVEPVEKWRKLKFEKLQRQWDYVFRRLFYTHTPDITTTAAAFAEPIEIDTVEETAGHITNLDLYVDQDGTAHVLYLKRPHQYDFIRDRYFPGDPMTVSLIYAVIRDGRVASPTELLAAESGKPGMHPSYARFHLTPDSSLLVVASATRVDADGKKTRDNWLIPLHSKSGDEAPTPLGLEHPFGAFFTNTVRGGSAPSNTLDLFGAASNHTLRYARVRLR